MTRPNTLRFALAAFVLFLAGARALAHIPPGAYLSMKLDEQALVQELTIRSDFLEDWTGIDANRWRPPKGTASVEVTDADRAELAKAHESWMRVTIDGVEVSGVVRDAVAYDIMDHRSTYTYLNLTVAYDVLGKARRVEFLWLRFDNTLNISVSPVDVEFDAYGMNDYASLTEKEPGWTWHAPLEKSQHELAEIPPPKPVPAKLELPVLSLGFGLLALVAVPVVLVKRVRPVRAAALVVLPLGIAVATLGTTRAEIELPWEAGYSMPDEAQAAAIFTDLHRNIYRAFRFDDEDRIYETLARTVEGDLLDDIYAEVYQSLILRDQGGAVCTIHSTEMLDTDVELPDDPEERQFRVTARWRVKGTVEHYGHKHVRMNEYRARYTVRWHDGGWKISGEETLDKKRVSPDD